LRDAGLVVAHAVCVLDRDEGGAAALAAEGVALQALFHAHEIWPQTATTHA
jgi:orotate phosphoribosyltransferase